MTKKNKNFEASAVALSGRELARCFEISPARVSQLTAEGVLRRDASGAYPLSANLRAYRTFLDRAIERRANPAATRLSEARARAIERRTAVEAERLVGFRETAKFLADVFAILRDEFDDLPPKFAAHRLDGAISDEIFDAFARAERRARAGIAAISRTGELPSEKETDE